MSLSDTIQDEGFRVQLSVSGRTFRVLPDGLPFPGIIDPQPDIDPRMDLGSDIRELAALHVRKDDFPSQVKQGDFIQQEPPSGQMWKAIRRSDNPADPTSSMLWVVKVTAKDG